MERKSLKVAILGAGICGLSCAIELEKNGVVPLIFERSCNPGWMWPSVSFWPNVFYNVFGEPRNYLLEQYKIDLLPLGVINKMTMKSPNRKVEIKGNLGWFMSRGTRDNSLANQLIRQLTQTAIYFNSKEDYKNLSERFDYVVIATGKDSEARELGVWEDEGIVNVISANVVGSFTPGTAEIYFNTDYAGTGYGRVTPFSSSSAIVSLCTIGKNELDLLQCFRDFIRKENLDKSEYVFRFSPPPFTTGKVNKFKVGNVLLSGRAAGLTERVLGCGGFEALVSGTLAAKAIVSGEDYDTLVKPIKDHVENISAFRKIVNKFNNEDFDKLISNLEIPGVKQVIYNSGISFTDMVGKVIKSIQN
ncbi:MAG TPA: NAD(P)-binding protein [Ruminiclostridium sp.]